MDFNILETKALYGDRVAHSSWNDWCKLNLRPEGKDVLDIGCGGGIYSNAFNNLGAKTVIGIDSSEQYIAELKRLTGKDSALTFSVGSASNTGLNSRSVDLVFERALIHHLSKEEQEENLLELKRVLRSSGELAIQDRTLDDVLSDDPKYWIRSTLLSTFPRLVAFEKSRRPSRSEYLDLIERLGFTELKVSTFSEVRRVYSSFETLEKEILSRKGKSILFQLTDPELKEYVEKLSLASGKHKLEEVDQWSIWTAKAP